MPSTTIPALLAGFGSATVLPCTFVSYYTGAALLGLLFPLYIMMAADSNPKLVYKRGAAVTGRWCCILHGPRNCGTPDPS